MASTRRDPSLDVLRGMCVASMVVKHMAMYSLLYKGTHAALWVDGATGFVLLAGLVIGMVQARAATSRHGLTRLGRRTVLVYAAHVGLVCVALVCASWDRMAPKSPPSAAALGGWPSALWQTVTLQINPFNVDILSMWVLATASASAYLAALWGPPGWAILPEYRGVEGFFDLAAWQALFVSGLLVGWHWHGKGVARAFESRRLAVAAGAAVVVLCVAAHLVERVGVLAPWGAVEDLTRSAFAKGTIGPGRLLLGWCAFTVLYYLLRHGRLGSVQRLLVAAFGRVGRRSLDSFVLLSIAVVVLGAVAPYQPASPVGMAWAGAVYAVIWCWAWLRSAGTWARLRKPSADRFVAAASERAAVATAPSGSS